MSSAIDVHPLAPEGVETEAVIEKSYRTPALLDSWVKNWTSVDKITTSQIVVLSPSKFNRSCLNGLDKIGGKNLIHDPSEWRNGEGILFSTIRSFKGLEADIVILVDVVEPGSLINFSQSDFYVACSRAKHLLKIVSEKEIDMLLNGNNK